MCSASHLPGTPPSPTPLSSPVPGMAARYRTDPCADEHPESSSNVKFRLHGSVKVFFFSPLRISKAVFFFTHRQLSPVSWGTRVGAPIHQFPLGMFGCMDAGRNSLVNRDGKDGKDEAGTEVETRSPTSSEKKPGI